MSYTAQPAAATQIPSDEVAPASSDPSLTSSGSLDYATQITAQFYASPWDRPPTHRWILSHCSAMGDIPSHHREFYPKPNVHSYAKA